MIKLLNILSEEINGTGTLPRGCTKYPNGSASKKLCNTLNKSLYRKITYPLIRKVFDMKKQKWNEVMSPEEQERTLSTLSRLKDLDPTRKWQWPSETGKITYGTIDEFINNRIPELGFLYREVDGNLEWDPVNKLDTNYSDLAVLITDIVEQSKTFTVEDLLNDLSEGNTNILQDVVDTVGNYPEILYDRFISDSDLYTTQSLYYSLQGEEVEDFVLESMLDCGWELIHQGGGGDIIDVFLGIDLIMEKNGELKTIQCKKVWKIENLPSTRMNPDSGAYRITGNVYVSKQRNVDLVGYGTLEGQTIIGGRQKEVVIRDKQYVYTDKMVLPKPEGSRYFYIDNPICTNIGGTLSEQFNRDRKLILTLQTLLNQSLVSVSREDWVDVETRADIDSIESIVVDEVFPKFGPYDFMVFATLNVSTSYMPNYAYENIMYYMEMEINKLLPNSKVEFKINNSNKNLSEQVNSNSDKLIKGIQSIIDQSLIRMEKETEEMGLGEMEFINEIESVEGVIVKNIQNIDMEGFGNRLHVDMYVNGPRYGFEDYRNTRSEIRYDINKLIPNTDVYFTIKDTRTFGPGIDY